MIQDTLQGSKIMKVASKKLLRKAMDNLWKVSSDYNATDPQKDEVNTNKV